MIYHDFSMISHIHSYSMLLFIIFLSLYTVLCILYHYLSSNEETEDQPIDLEKCDRAAVGCCSAPDPNVPSLLRAWSENGHRTHL